MVCNYYILKIVRRTANQYKSLLIDHLYLEIKPLLTGMAKMTMFQQTVHKDFIKRLNKDRNCANHISGARISMRHIYKIFSFRPEYERWEWQNRSEEV